MPVIPGYGKQENGKFEASLNYLDPVFEKQREQTKTLLRYLLLLCFHLCVESISQCQGHWVLIYAKTV